MNNVLREILLACGDEYLRAGDFVCAVPCRDSAGFNKPEIGAAMGFCQAHRP